MEMPKIIALKCSNCEKRLECKTSERYQYLHRKLNELSNEFKDLNYTTTLLCHDSKAIVVEPKLNEEDKNDLPNLKVKYHYEICPELLPIEINEVGDLIDLRSAKRYELKKGQHQLINLGVSIQLPKGYTAKLVPRSSTFKNFKIIEVNSPGCIDESYCGDNDIWMMNVLAMEDTVIEINDRICQFEIQKKQPFTIETVETLGNNDRGGFGSTGVK